MSGWCKWINYGPGTWNGATYSIPGNLGITGEFDAYNGQLPDRGYARWSGNVWTIGTEANGGTARPMAFQVPGTSGAPLGFGFSANSNSSYTLRTTGFQFIPSNAANAGGTLGTGAVDFSLRGAGSGATGVNSFAVNNQTIAGGQYSAAFGTYSSSPGTASFAANFATTAQTDMSSAWGAGGVTGSYGQVAWGHGGNTTGIRNQTSIIGFSGTTTDNSTATILYVCGLAAGTQNAVVPTKSMWYFDIRLVGRDAAGASATPTSYAVYTVTGVIARSTGTSVAIVGTPTVTKIMDSGGTATVSPTADSTTSSLRLTVTSATATTMRWVATCLLTEVNI